jgi:hypothetical protein
MNHPFIVICQPPGIEPRIITGFDDYYSANHHALILNQETNTQPYKVVEKSAIAQTLGE